jgi:hypothetical protein
MTTDREQNHVHGYGCFYRSLGGFLLLMLLCGIAGSVAIYLQRQHYQRQLRAAVESIQAKGQPLDGTQLNAFYAVPASSDDRTALYLRALAHFADRAPYHTAAQPIPVVGVGEQQVPPPGTPWPELSSCQAFLLLEAVALRDLHNAAAEPGAVRYPVDFRGGIATLLPHAQQVRTAVRLLDLECQVKLHEHDSAAAAKSLVAMLRTGETLADEPIIISQLVRMAAFSIFVERLREYLEYGELSDEDLRMLQRAVAEVDFAHSQTRALLGERAIAYETLQNTDFQTLQSLQGGSQQANMPMVGSGNLANMRPGDTAVLLNMLTEMIEASEEPFPEANQKMAAAEARLQQFFAEDQKQLPWDRHVLAQLMLPALKRVGATTGERVALQRAALAAVVAARYRVAHGGEPPESLDALVPEFLDAVPDDPFLKQPLLYKVDAAELIIYSVGSDGVDDGGVVASGYQRGRDVGVKIRLHPK